MLTDEIFDRAQELANDNALWVQLYNVDIIHRISQMVEENLADTRFAPMAVAAYRYYERKKWQAHNEVCELEELLSV